jgi:DNA-binding transcriptional MerR regulator
MTGALFSIGDVATQLSVSTRTLRYYEEIGLLTPTGRSAGGARRYTELDVARVAHIRRLQTVMGFDLDRIRDFLNAEDELARLRAEYSAGTAPAREQQIASEAAALYDRMRGQVIDKRAALDAFLAELDEKSAKARRKAASSPARTSPARTSPAGTSSAGTEG